MSAPRVEESKPKKVNKPSEQLFIKISVAKAKENKAFWAITKNSYRKEAIQTIQHAYRISRDHFSFPFKGAVSKALDKPLTMFFLTEPYSEIKCREHVGHILNGNWLKLDFGDPQFTRTIYKALRLGLINTYQLATVTLLYDAIRFFQDNLNFTRINQYSFEEKGPYDPATISYATPEKLAHFSCELKLLPAADRHYLTIDFPIEHTLIFLMLGIERITFEEYDYSATFKNMLKKYFLKQVIPLSEKSKLLVHLENLPRKEDGVILISFIEKQLCALHPEKIHIVYERKIKLILSDKLRNLYNNLTLLVALVRLNEQNPAIIISPKYDEQVCDSPLLAMVLPTIAAYMKLQYALHGKDCTFPDFTIGEFSLENMLDTVKPSDNLRLIELVCPGVKPAKKTHGIVADPLLLTWHDLFFHLWSNGTNKYKNLYHHLIHSLQTYKKINMSNAIFNLLDKDLRWGKTTLEAAVKGGDTTIIDIQHIAELLDKHVGINFWAQLASFDQNLLIIIDMIVNKEKWKACIGSYIEDFFPEMTLVSNHFISSGIAYEARSCAADQPLLPYNFTSFQNVLAKMKTIISANPKENIYGAILLYVLLYRFKENPSICNLVLELDGLGLELFFSWSKNGGIYINHIIFQKENCFVEKLSEEEFIFHINPLLDYEKKSFVEKCLLDEKVVFTRVDEKLLAKVKPKYPWIFPWDAKVKLAVLVDIYRGRHPKIFMGDASKASDYLKALYAYCEKYKFFIPKFIEDDKEKLSKEFVCFPSPSEIKPCEIPLRITKTTPYLSTPATFFESKKTETISEDISITQTNLILTAIKNNTNPQLTKAIEEFYKKMYGAPVPEMYYDRMKVKEFYNKYKDMLLMPSAAHNRV